jgi:hypothetical protein
MVRPVSSRGAWKAGLAIAVVAAALIWHILACIESPMAFSPNGKDLAFVTMEPYTGDDIALAGTHVYRLMVLSEGKPLRTLEETSRYMLTAPAWSPDGTRMAYLRIMLLEKEQQDRIKELVKKNKEARRQLSEAVGRKAWTEAPLPPQERARRASRSSVDEKSWTDAPLPPVAPGASEPPAKAPESTGDLSLPPAAGTANYLEQQFTLMRPPAMLVVRDAATGQVVSAMRTFTTPMDVEGAAFFMSYLMVRPQFSPDGHLIYLCNGSEVLAMNPEENKQWIVAAPASVAVLSPDGATVAALGLQSLALLRPKTDSAVYRRLGEDDAPLSGLAWVDKDTVAVFRPKKDGEAAPRIDLYRTDGTLAKSIPLKLPRHETNDTNQGELAIAPNGAGLVLAFGKDVFFMKMDGTILRHWKGDKEVLAQPTFTPDSKQVAFKLLVRATPEGKEPNHTAAIVFFSPDGKELRRAEVPAAKPPAPSAEKEPADKPAAEKKPAEAKPADVKPAETKPADVKPAEK